MGKRKRDGKIVPPYPSKTDRTTDYWKCECEMWPKEYVPIELYLDFVDTAVFDSDFKPKNVTVLDCAVVWMLPKSDHFALLEELKGISLSITNLPLQLIHSVNTRLDFYNSYRYNHRCNKIDSELRS